MSNHIALFYSPSQVVIGKINHKYPYFSVDIPDPYVQVHIPCAVGTQTCRTRVVPNCIDPIWNERLSFMVPKTLMETAVATVSIKPF